MRAIYFYIAALLIFSLSSVTGQRTNPFEIKERLEADSSAIQSSTISAVSENKVAVINTVIEEVTKDISGEQTGMKDNPFEVDKKKKASSIDNSSQKAKTEIQILKKDSSEQKTNFLFWVILFSFLLLAVTLSLDRWFITKVFKSVFNYNISNTLMRETNGFNLIVLILLYILFLIVGGVFVYLLLGFFADIQGILYFWICLGAVSGVYISRHLIMNILLLIFPGISELHQYNFTIASFNIVLGISLLLPTLLLAFSYDNIAMIASVLGLLLVGILYILRTLRGLLISFNYLNSIPLHFFLYLCAFEIVPMMVMYKLIADFV